MKTAKTLLFLLLLLGGAAAGWYFGQRSNSMRTPETGRKVLYYQSPMHPWIKSDKPGNCTICGMKLTAVYEGEKGVETDGRVVTLSSNAINVLNVKTETAEVRAIERTLDVAGRIEMEETRFRVLAAYVDGRIEKLFVNYVGAEVEQGQPLAVIYSPALLTAEREYLTVVTRTNAAVSAEFAGEQGRLIEAARQRLKRLGLTDEQIGGLREKGASTSVTQVVAPIGGTVITRAVLEGQYVKEGEKLFEIADLSKMWFRFDVYEQDLPMVAVGQPVKVTTPALAGRSFEGVVTFIDPNINEASRSARVRVELDNPLLGENGAVRRELYNGLYATGRIELKSAPVLTVSRGAVVDPGDSPRIYVDRGSGAYEQRSVLPGLRGPKFIEIRSGLAAGERVVSSGNLLLDSQAQISLGAISHQHGAEQNVTQTETPQKQDATPREQSKTPAFHLDPEQVNAATNFLARMDALSAALSSDNLTTFNGHLAAAESAASRLNEALAATPHAGDLARDIESKAHLQAAPDLAAARASYLPLSLVSAEFARALRQHVTNVNAKVYKCPMYPESGRNAFWVQLTGPLRNPFFGAEMLDCGVEVK